MAGTSNDASIVLRAKDGDAAAITAMYEENAPRLYRYFLPRVAGRSQQAEDLTEEVFVRVIERLEQYEDRGLPFGAWLFRIAHNLLIDHQRRLPKQPMIAIDECEELRGPADKQIQQVLDQHVIAIAMASVTRDQRNVIRLRFIEGLTIVQTATALGKTEESVKKLQARGLMAMRRIIEGSAKRPRTDVPVAVEPVLAFAS
jgi:RNA polymerase sigma-70 factor (ECF subfamily)